MDLPDFNERYEIELPTMSMHNFVIGTPYIDIGETMKVTRQGTNERAFINYHRRGWFAKDKDIAKLDGEVFTEVQKGKKTARENVSMLISGNWNGDIFV